MSEVVLEIVINVVSFTFQTFSTIFIMRIIKVVDELELRLINRELMSSQH